MTGRNGYTPKVDRATYKAMSARLNDRPDDVEGMTFGLWLPFISLAIGVGVVLGVVVAGLIVWAVNR